MTTHRPLPTPPLSHRLTYRIARGEKGVLTFEPYKSYLLPLWRFRTIPISKSSSSALYHEFERFHEVGDFVGMDTCRKFIQMGMTRAKRYANYKGGRKFVGGRKGEGGVEIGKSEGHRGKEEKEGCSKVFRGVWERCREHEGYKTLKEEFLREQRVCDRVEKERVRKGVKEEDMKSKITPITTGRRASRSTHVKKESTSEPDVKVEIRDSDLVRTGNY